MGESTPCAVGAASSGTESGSAEGVGEALEATPLPLPLPLLPLLAKWQDSRKLRAGALGMRCLRACPLLRLNDRRQFMPRLRWRRWRRPSVLISLHQRRTRCKIQRTETA